MNKKILQTPINKVENMTWYGDISYSSLLNLISEHDLLILGEYHSSKNMQNNLLYILNHINNIKKIRFGTELIGKKENIEQGILKNLIDSINDKPLFLDYLKKLVIKSRDKHETKIPDDIDKIIERNYVLFYFLVKNDIEFFGGDVHATGKNMFEERDQSIAAEINCFLKKESIIYSVGDNHVNNLRNKTSSDYKVISIKQDQGLNDAIFGLDDNMIIMEAIDYKGTKYTLQNFQ